MNAADSDGDESRMSRDTATVPALQIGGEAAADGVRGFLVELAGIEAADVVGLEDRRIDLHGSRISHRSAEATSSNAKSRGRECGIQYCDRESFGSEAGEIGQRRAIAEHGAVLERDVAPEVAVASDDRVAHGRLAARPACSAR